MWPKCRDWWVWGRIRALTYRKVSRTKFIFRFFLLLFHYRSRSHWFQLNKKNELIESKAMIQIDTVLPQELREFAKQTLQVCKDVRMYRIINFSFCRCSQTTQFDFYLDFSSHNISSFCLRSVSEHNYKESCDRLFYLTQCMYNNNPEKFLYPWVNINPKRQTATQIVRAGEKKIATERAICSTF